MERVKYESPRFEFQELRLIERVADTCWGYGYGWYDQDGNGVHDGEEIINFGFLGGKCNEVGRKLQEMFNLQNKEDYAENSHSKVIRPIIS